MEPYAFQRPVFKFLIKRIIIPQISVVEKKLFVAVFNTSCNSERRLIDDGKSQAYVEATVPVQICIAVSITALFAFGPDRKVW